MRKELISIITKLVAEDGEANFEYICDAFYGIISSDKLDKELTKMVNEGILTFRNTGTFGYYNLKK